MSKTRGISVDVSGGKRVAAFLKNLDKRTDGLIDDIIKVNANEIAAKAKGAASRTTTPKATGTLALSINVRKVAPLVYGVGSNVTYAAYQEFGTGSFASGYVPTLPPEIRRIASKYRGKGIRNVNIRAKKFLYENVEDQIPVLLRDLGDAIEGALNART